LERLEGLNLMWGKVVGGEHLGVARSSIAHMMCSQSGVYSMEIRIPDDKRLSSKLVGWINKLHLTFEQRQAFRLGLLDQGIFIKLDLAILDVSSMMQALATAAAWEEPWAQVKEGQVIADKLRTLKYMEIANLKRSGHTVTVSLANKGGSIKSWLLPVSSNCNRVSPHLLQVTHFAVTELLNRGFLPNNFLSLGPALDRLKMLKGSWSLDGVVVLSSTIGEMLCKGGGDYKLNVVLPNEQYLGADLVAWMNQLVLTYEQRTALRQAFIAQKIVDLSSVRGVDVAEVMKALVCPSCPDALPGFKGSIQHQLLSQKSFLLHSQPLPVTI